MGNRISITAGEITLDAELNDSDHRRSHLETPFPSPRPATPGAMKSISESRFCRFLKNPDGLREVVDFGDLAFWPPGNAFCIFFGPTPASRGDEIRPASPVAIVGRITGDAAQLKQVPAGAAVAIEPYPIEPYPLRGIEVDSSALAGEMNCR